MFLVPHAEEQDERVELVKTAQRRARVESGHLVPDGLPPLTRDGRIPPPRRVAELS